MLYFRTAGCLLTVLISLTACSYVESLRSIAPDAIGEVKRIEGRVTILRGAASHQAGPGTDIFTGDVIITGVNATVATEMIDETMLVLGSNSELAIHIYSYQQPGPMARLSFSRGSLQLDRGKFSRADEHTFEISTRVAEIDVQAGFSARYQDDQGLAITLTDQGTVVLHNQFGNLALSGRNARGGAKFGEAPEEMP